jgi:hypothetical protein
LIVSQIKSYYGPTENAVGSGSQILNFQRGIRTIKAILQLILPANAVDPKVIRNSNISTPWVQQSCSMDVFLGKANFSLQYTLDDWNTVRDRLTINFFRRCCFDEARAQPAKISFGLL